MEHPERLAVGAVAVAGVLAGCRTPFLGVPEDRARRNDAGLAREMSTLGFGLTPGQLEAAGARSEWVAAQLAAEADVPLHLNAALHRLDVLRLDPVTLMDLPDQVVLDQLQRAAILRATYNLNQLFERMVDFWTDHFNVYAKKGLGIYWLTASQESVIRRHALGSFRDLLVGVERSPAMLSYLDNGANRRGQVNENLAREILELHTLGVDGGYSQKDVQEFARCLTGWRVEDRFLRARGTFRFDATRHEDGPFTILGKRYDQPDEGAGMAVLADLARHRSTALHLAKKLLKYFSRVDDSRAVNKVADAFLESDGNLRATMGAVADVPIGTPRLRRPFEYLVACLRATGAQTDAGPAIGRHLVAMGQGTHLWPMPDGYPISDRAWSSALLARWNFAFALAEGRIAGTFIPPEIRKDVRSQYITGDERKSADAWATVLASPDFQRSAV